MLYCRCIVAVNLAQFSVFWNTIKIFITFFF